ncbi:PAS domain S-box-containing protein [Inhella inkyongensis]|uniref:Virulence sensor protein BvgS n=1 Tax=Inhella inkyongensis TaxID=392593 RepID=A0A840S5M0_9BURK|nr:ATP-binding protein [Inhella inkyongensis]MBB5205695.1 PAS domain S-box-containing protein [Inhella inkyongensis]
MPNSNPEALKPAAEPLPEAAGAARAQRELGERMAHGVAVMLAVAGVAGLAQAAATWWGGGRLPPAQLALIACLGLAFSLMCAFSYWRLKRRGVHAAMAWFGGASLSLLLSLPWITGTGLSDAGLPALVVVVLALGLLVSPRAAKRALALSLLGVAAVALGQWMGWIPGPSDARPTPLAVLVLGHSAALLLGGWLVIHYSQVFFDALGSAESSRLLLADSLQQQNEAAEQLRLSEARQRQLLEGSLTAVLIFGGKDGVIRYANQRTLEAYGVERMEQLRPDWVMPGEGYGREEALRLFERTLNQGPQYQWWCSQRRDGTLIWWDIKTLAQHQDTDPQVVVFGHDISAQVAARAALTQAREQLEAQVRARTQALQAQQQRMEAILEALPLTLSIRDGGGRYQLVNRQFERSSGWRREQVLGRRSHDFLPAAEAAQIASTDAEILRVGGVQHYEQALVHPAEGLRELLFTSVAMQDSEVGGYTVLTLGTDISSLKRLQHELEQARDDAQRLAQAKSDFLANMSHEIRTPLNAVLGLAQLALLREPAGAYERQAFEGIRSAGEHLLGVVNDILDFAKLESGKYLTSCDVVDPLEPPRGALAMLEARAREKRLGLRLQVEGELPRRVQLDLLHTRQVLVNLIGNALKFTQQGEVLVRVSAHDGRLWFAVHDTGPGIDAAQQERIFQAFEQADVSATRQFGGTGLGLSISRRLARLMGGDINLQSSLGQGSTFTLHLPCVALAEPTGMAPGDSGPRPQTPSAQLAGLRVLVVDDVELNRAILMEMLQSQGALCQQADSGAQALACMDAPDCPPFDVVLMDVQMPGMDGYETTRLLHSRRPELPVFALTAHALPEQVELSRAAGMAGHITKPVELSRLVEALMARLRPAASPTTPTPTEPAPPAPAKPEATSILGWDYAAALARCAGKAPLLRRLLTDFEQQYRQPMPEGGEALRAWAHRLKGTAGNLGLTALATGAGELEQSALTVTQQQQTELKILLQRQLDSLANWLDQAA